MKCDNTFGNTPYHSRYKLDMITLLGILRVLITLSGLLSLGVKRGIFVAKNTDNRCYQGCYFTR